MNEKRITPEEINSLEKDEVFVFGSNESGIHGAGAAALAYKKFGAQFGKGWGLSAQCFAIPTKDWEIKTLPLEVIEFYVERFIAFSQGYYHSKWKFYVTKIGCGLAGYTVEDIAPFFKECLNYRNIYLPQEFHDFLDKFKSDVSLDKVSWHNKLT